MVSKKIPGNDFSKTAEKVNSIQQMMLETAILGVWTLWKMLKYNKKSLNELERVQTRLKSVVNSYQSEFNKRLKFINKRPLRLKGVGK